MVELQGEIRQFEASFRKRLGFRRSAISPHQSRTEGGFPRTFTQAAVQLVSGFDKFVR